MIWYVVAGADGVVTQYGNAVDEAEVQQQADHLGGMRVVIVPEKPAPFARLAITDDGRVVDLSEVAQ